MQVAKQQGEYLAGLLGSGACKPGQPMNGVKVFRSGQSFTALFYFTAIAIPQERPPDFCNDVPCYVFLAALCLPWQRLCPGTHAENGLSLHVRTYGSNSSSSNPGWLRCMCRYNHKGSLAYVGRDKAVMDIPTVGPLTGWTAGTNSIVLENGMQVFPGPLTDFHLLICSSHEGARRSQWDLYGQ